MGVINHDDVPRRRYDEASRFFAEMNRLKPEIPGSHVRMDLGIAGADFDNQQAHKTCPMGLPAPMEDAILLHRHCHDQGIACGFIHPEDDLTRLKVFYVPHWVMRKPEWTARVEAFVAQGGTLILSALTGTRDLHNHIPMVQAPAMGLAEPAGGKVQEFGRLAAPDATGLFPPRPDRHVGAHVPGTLADAASASRQYRFTLGNQEFTAARRYEKLALAQGTKVLGQWSTRCHEGTPAITARSHGTGRVVYVGTYLTPELAAQPIEVVCAPAGVVPLLPNLPAGVEVSVRQPADRTLYFIQNTTKAPASLSGVLAGTDLLTDRPVNGVLTLKAYGCDVIKVSKARHDKIMAPTD